MTGFWVRGRTIVLIAVTAVCAIIAALLTTQPVSALPADRLPSDGATVSEVPVLTWPTVQRAASYELQVSKTATFSTTIVEQTRETPAYLFVDDLAPGRYYWRYRGKTSDGSWMNPSATWSFTRGSEHAPTLIAPLDGAVLPYPTTSPTLKWQPVASFGRYTVQWDDNRDFRSPQEATTVGTTFTLPVLQPQDPEKVLYWRVRATATSLDNVTTAWSQVRSFKVKWGESAPELLSPENSPSVDDAVDQPVFRWRPTAGAATYELQIGLDDQFTTLVHPDTGVDYPSSTSESPFIVNSTSYVPPTRYPAKSHWWRVRAVDGNGAPGPWSASWHFTRRWTEPDETIGDTSAEPAARPNNVTLDADVPLNEFEMSWDAVPDTTFYEVEVSTDPAFHANGQRAVCKTPHNYFAPEFDGLYLDAAREDTCPINVPESALPPIHDSTYLGSGNQVTIAGSGASQDATVLLYFGAGDPQNGLYTVTSVIEDIPDTPFDESGFVVDLTRPGTGPVQWRLQPGLVLTAGVTYYFRVRAVHETLAGKFVYSVWSDQADTVDGNAPGPAIVTPSANSTGATPPDEPAEPIAPATDTTWSDWPILRWNAALDADAYLVAIAKDREFTNSILKDLGSGPHFEYYVTRDTFMVPQTTLAENTAGGSYYWYVLPCAFYQSPEINTCAAPDRDAILKSGRWRSFHNQSNALTSLADTPAATEPAVTLSWDDTYQSNPIPPTIGTGGYARYELQITDSTWAKAATFTTETARFHTAGLPLEPATVYRWRVRAVDGGLLPMSWAPGDDFALPSFSGPVAAAIQDDATGHPCLQWGASSLATGYDVEVFEGTDADFPESAKVQEASTAYSSYCPAGLAGGTYSWRVRSKHGISGKSVWTTDIEDHMFQVKVGPPVLTSPLPPAPSDPSASVGVSVRKLKFAWTAVAGAASYLVEVSTDAFWTVTRTGQTVSNLWLPNDLEPGEYSWRVKALDAYENVLSTSDVGNITVSRLTVRQFTPTSGPTAGGTVVTLLGTGFAPDAEVRFDGTLATTQTRTGSTSLTVKTPSHAAGPVEVVVTNPDAVDPAQSESYYALEKFTYIAPPVLTGLDPASGPTSGGTMVTLSGTNLDADAAVEFDGYPAEVSSPHGATSMTVTTPPHESGPVDVTVINHDGQVATAASKFTYVAAPEVNEITPMSGPPDGGTRVTITGENFDPDATVDFGGTPAEVTKPHTATSMEVTTPSHAAGRVDVVVTNEDGQSFTAKDQFVYGDPLSITMMAPESGPAAGGAAVTITGTGFDPGASVTFGGTDARVTDRTGSTSITVDTPSHAAGEVPVVVTNGDGQQVTAGTDYLYVAGPTISSMRPSSGPAAGGTTVTITGTDLDPLSTVTFGGDPAIIASSTGTTALMVRSPAHAAGQVTVLVTSPDGQTASDTFTYLAPPSAVAFSPRSGPTAGGTTVTISGEGFDPEASVTFGGSPGSVVKRDGTTSIAVKSPAHPAGSVEIAVVNPDGAAATAEHAYTYVAPPIVAGFVPQQGPTEGCKTLSITGTTFDPTAEVLIDGVVAPVSQRSGSTEIIVTTPGHPAGEVDVLVRNGDGQQAGASSKFTYLATPRIGSVTPGSGSVSGYTAVRITGENFSPTARVSFDGTEATVTGRSGTQVLTALSPVHSAGSVDVQVTNPDGQVATAKKAFTYVQNTGTQTDTPALPWFVTEPRLRVVGQRLTARWSRPTSPGAPADTYRLMVKRDSGNFRTVVTTSSRRARISVRPGHTYWVRVVPHSSAGWGQPGPAARRQVR